MDGIHSCSSKSLALSGIPVGLSTQHLPAKQRDMEMHENAKE